MPVTLASSQVVPSFLQGYRNKSKWASSPFLQCPVAGKAPVFYKVLVSLESKRRAMMMLYPATKISLRTSFFLQAIRTSSQHLAAYS